MKKKVACCACARVLRCYRVGVARVAGLHGLVHDEPRLKEAGKVGVHHKLNRERE